MSSRLELEITYFLLLTDAPDSGILIPTPPVVSTAGCGASHEAPAFNMVFGMREQAVSWNLVFYYI